MTSIAERSWAAAGLFEAEVLTELLLWRWGHPLKNDADFRTTLLEDAVVALRRAAGGEQLFDSVPPGETSLIAALYYAEWNAISIPGTDSDGARLRWLDQFRRALPSCFCSQEDLPPT